MKYKIIAFTGLAMTGKTTARIITKQLLDEKNIKNSHIHLGSTEEVARRDQTGEWTTEEQNLTQQQKEQLIRERWRSEFGMGVMAEKALPRIHELVNLGTIVIIDNLSSYEEKKIITKAFGEDSLLVVALAGDWLDRVRRGKNRASRPLNATELKKRDEAEAISLHKAATIVLADFTIVNNIDEQTDPDAAQHVIRDALTERVLPVFLD